MTSIALPRRPFQDSFKRKLKNRPTRQSWPGYVVPVQPLADLIESRKNEFMPFGAHQEDVGWREALAAEVAEIRTTSTQAVIRRLHDITHRRSKIAYVGLADAICLALGIDLDRDTDIPTLPGSYGAALDLIRCRAESAGVKLNRKEEQRLAEQARRIGLLIIHYPHNTERLLDLAPFDCLRPEKW